MPSAPCAAEFTAITAEAVELMEIDRKDFDRVLKADRSSEKGRLIDFLNGLPMMQGTSVFAIQTLCNLVSKRVYMRSQLCLAHPPHADLTSASYDPDYVYIIFAGEARLLCGSDQQPPPSDAPKPAAAAPGAISGPMNEAPPPVSAKVEKYVTGGAGGGADHGSLIPVATLGPGECISDNLLPHPWSRWCIKPITHLELLVMPRKEWVETLRPASLSTMREIGGTRAAFFEHHLEHTVETNARRRTLEAEQEHMRHRRAARDAGLNSSRSSGALGGGAGGGAPLSPVAATPGRGGGAMADAASSPMADGGVGSPPPSKRGGGAGSRSVRARYQEMLSADSATGGGDVSPLTKRSVYRPIDSPRTSTSKLGSPNAAAEMGGSPTKGGSTVRLPNISSPSATGGANAAAGGSGSGGGGSPRDGNLPPIGSPAGAPSDNGGYAYKPAIYLERRSQMGMRPLISGA